MYMEHVGHTCPLGGICRAHIIELEGPCIPKKLFTSKCSHNKPKPGGGYIWESGAQCGSQPLSKVPCWVSNGLGTLPKTLWEALVLTSWLWHLANMLLLAWFWKKWHSQGCLEQCVRFVVHRWAGQIVNFDFYAIFPRHLGVLAWALCASSRWGIPGLFFYFLWFMKMVTFAYQACSAPPPHS